jgi:hypothetical protein
VSEDLPEPSLILGDRIVRHTYYCR